MKKRIKQFPLIIVVCICLVALTGSVLAYMFRQTGYTDNQFTPAKVSCQVVEEFDETQKTSIKVQNTGNIDAYLRIRLVSYWVNSEGNIVAKPSIIPDFTLGEGWIEGPNNTYY